MKKTQTLGILATLTSAIILSGCNAIPKRSAGETFRMAVDKSFDKDKSYNFAIKQEISLTPAQDRKKVSIEDAGYKALEQDAKAVAKSSEEMMADCDDAFDKALADKSASESVTERAEKDYVTCLKAASKANKENSLEDLSEQFGGDKVKKVMTPERINAINEYWLKPINIELNGAVDTDKKRILVDYRLGFKPRNFTIAINFPMMFDFDEMSFALDPALLLPFIGPTFDKEVGTSWNDKWVKFTLPEEYKKEIPAELVLTAFKNALKQSYTGIDDKYLSYSDKGSLGRQLGASQAVTMKMPAKQKIFLIENLITNWVKELEKEAAANPSAIKNPETFESFMKEAKEMTAKGAILGEFEDLLSDDDFVNVFFGNAENTFFLNGGNSVVGMLGTQKITALADIINADINSKTITKITNHNRADFSMVPTGDNMVDGNALIEKVMSGEIKNPFESDSESDDSDDKAEECIDEALEKAEQEGRELSTEEQDKVVYDCHEEHAEPATAAIDAAGASVANNEDAEKCIEEKLENATQNGSVSVELEDRIIETCYKEYAESVEAVASVAEVVDAAASADSGVAEAASAVAEAAVEVDAEEAAPSTEVDDFCRLNPKYANSERCRKASNSQIVSDAVLKDM